MPAPFDRAVEIPVEGAQLSGDLHVAVASRGVILFAHGSGSSRLSPRNRFVARELQHSGFATLLMDLLTPDEEESERWTRHLRFDIPMLALRLATATAWLRTQPGTADLPVGYFGSSTGAAAALVAASANPKEVRAVVSRGGRPDLAGEALGRIRTPTLLIVGGRDPGVLSLNRESLGRLRVEKDLRIVPGATHLFEEPGALEQVVGLAQEWFTRHLHLARGTALTYWQ